MRWLLGIVLGLGACVASSGDDVDHVPGAGGKADDPHASTLPAQLPAWGGEDRSRWTTEALIANTVTEELQRTGDPFARVSIPASLQQSSYAPFGDGQTNAAIDLAAWSQRRVPVVATRSGTRLTIRFDRALPLSDASFELWTWSGAWVQTVGSTRTADGDWLVEVANVPAALRDQLLVSPRGWRDVFPLSFVLPTTRVASLAQSVPAALRKLPGGEPVVDPIGAAAATSPVAALDSATFPAGFINQDPFVAEQLHGSLPQSGPPRITAVGRAFTWVAMQPFKDLYVCFERRQLAREAELGVPSGAGWHHIGDPGESILSSLETTPILVGYARGVATYTLPGGAQASYGLAQPTAYGLLHPGDAFTTPRGDFHWYAVHHDVNPCVQVWVHRCEPSASAPSFACPGD